MSAQKERRTKCNLMWWYGVVVDCRALGFAVWGEVSDGLAVAEAISALPTAVKSGMKMLVTPLTLTAELLIQ
jgi:hypothetical protein